MINEYTFVPILRKCSSQSQDSFKNRLLHIFFRSLNTNDFKRLIKSIQRIQILIKTTHFSLLRGRPIDALRIASVGIIRTWSAAKPGSMAPKRVRINIGEGHLRNSQIGIGLMFRLRVGKMNHHFFIGIQLNEFGKVFFHPISKTKSFRGKIVFFNHVVLEGR